MKIHIASDLHLCFGHFELPGGADILILAGDITEHKDIEHDRIWFERECAKYPQVFYVFGNHEYYNGYLDATPKVIAEAMPANVRILERGIVEVGEWTFVGTTLWTDMNRGCPMTKYHVKSMMNDFRKIARVKEPWQRFTPDHAQAEHYKARAYIEEIARQHPNGKLFVITHHAPTSLSVHPRFAHDRLMNGAYVSDLSDLILDHPNIKYWVHGHLHDEFDYMVGDDCRVLCHPRGYAGHDPISQDYQPLEIEI